MFARRIGVVVAALASLACGGISWGQAYYYWNKEPGGGPGNWAEPTYWSPEGVPHQGYSALVQNGGTVQITGNQSCDWLQFGGTWPADPSGNGYGEMTGGQLTLGYGFIVGKVATSTFHHSGGTISLTSSRFDMAHYSGSHGEYYLSGNALFYPREMLVGEGDFTWIWEGDPTPPATALFVQTGGTCYVNNGGQGGTVHVGYSDHAEGEYRLTGGVLEIDNYFGQGGDLIVGEYMWVYDYPGGKGTFRLGDAAGTGTLIALNLTVRQTWYGAQTSDAEGTFRGWSRDMSAVPSENHFQLTGEVENNGRIIADGFGNDDLVLDMSGVSSILNGLDNFVDENNPNADCGWFAQDHGKLVLPSIPVANADVGYNWGEPQNDSVIDLVNSLRITPTTLRGSGGDLQVALLDRDRDEPLDAQGPIWDPQASTCCQVLGVWEFSGATSSSPIPFSQADLVIRYDHSRYCATDAPLVPGKFIAGTWKVVDWCGATVDTTNHWFTKTGVAFPASGAMYIALAPTRPGDINFDGTCDVLDLLYFVDAFGTIKGDANYDPAADFNCDDAVDVTDLLYLVDRFGCDSCVVACESQGLWGEESRMMGAAMSGEEQPAWQEALEQVGLLDVYMQYIAEHPEAARTW
jgi:hypothetical protein